MQSKIVDIHPHIVSGDTDHYPVAPLAGNRSNWSEKRPADFELMIAAMDEAGVDKAALVQSATTYGYDNSYVADCIALQPNRFAGIFSVDMSADDAPDKIRYWVGKKFSGMRLYSGGTTNKQLSGMADPKTYHSWECAAELGIPVCVSLRKEGLADLNTLIKEFSKKVRIIVDHMVEPPISEGPPYNNSEFLFNLAQYDNVYLKMTTNNIRTSLKDKGFPEVFWPLLVKKFGASRIAWGSNYPSASGSLKEIVIEAKKALSSLSDLDREWIFARTAQSLYPALADK